MIQTPPRHHQTETQHIAALARMQSTLRHRRIEHLSFLESSMIQFPPIASVTLAFPSVHPQKSGVKNSQRRKKMQQLEKYLDSSGRKGRLDASHVFSVGLRSKKTILNRTLRGVLYSSLQQKHIRGDSLQMGRVQRQGNNLKQGLGKQLQQGKDFKDFKARMLDQLGLRATVEKRYSSLGMSGELDKMRDTQKARKKEEKAHNSQLSPQRYSPWRSEELQDQLVL